MAKIDGSTYTSDAQKIMTVGVGVVIAIAIDTVYEVTGTIELTSTGEENARELVVVGLCVKPISGFYLFLNWHLSKSKLRTSLFLIHFSNILFEIVYF